MPSRNRKKRSKQRAKYLPKQDDILSQENKAKARARYKADPEMEKALYATATRPIPKRRPLQRYQEDLEETVLLKGSDIKRTSRRTAPLKYEDNSAAIKASEGIGIGMTPLSDWLNVLPRGKRYRRGHRTTLPPKGLSTENDCLFYSLYEPKSHALMEYNGGLEKAIRRDSELLSEVNDALYAPYRPPPAAAAQLPPIASSSSTAVPTATSSSSSRAAPTAQQQKQQLQHCPRCCQQKQQEHRYLHQPPPPAPALAPVPPPPLRLLPPWPLPPPPAWLSWPEPGCRG
eukprot:Em0003g1654a